MENNYLSIALNDYEYALRSRYPDLIIIILSHRIGRCVRSY